jgi:hypothetical protein
MERITTSERERERVAGEERETWCEVSSRKSRNVTLRLPFKLLVI